MRTVVPLLLVLALPLSGAAQLKTLTSAADIASAIDGFGTLGSVLYIAAHPDDENSALLAYLANGRHLRTAYLSTTRGEGGQNLIGSEQGEALGIVRTEELLAARRIDGAEQFFTRAIDFGYSKSSEEALRLWDRDSVLADMVWVIRSFRPDVIITRFSPTLGTHGHHTASAILAREAFDAAADPSRFPAQLAKVRPWKARRLLFNEAAFFNQPFDTAKAIAVDVGVYDKLLGRSYTELAGLSRSMHKSQGFGAAQSRGPAVNYFLPTAGEPARTDLFDGIDMTWGRIPGGERIDTMAAALKASFSPADPAGSVPALLGIYRALRELPADGWVEYKKNACRELLRACLGLWAEAIAADSAVVPGGSIAVAVTAVNRSSVPVRLLAVGAPFASRDSLVNLALENNRPVTAALTAEVPRDASPSMPYWLVAPPRHEIYRTASQAVVGLPESAPPLETRITLLIARDTVGFSLPVTYRWVDPVEGELRRPAAIIPAIDVSVEGRALVFPNLVAKNLTVRLHCSVARSRGIVRLETPGGWEVDKREQPYLIERRGGEADVVFRIRKTAAAGSGMFRVVARDSSGADYARGLRSLRYPHIIAQTFSPRAEGKLVALSTAVRRQTIGYIMGSGDEVPAALRQLGYSVLALTADDLEHGDLGKCEAIVAGVRAYNTRPELRASRQRLLDYVRNGGTYVVQYCVPEAGETDAIGPLPLTISRDRVADEDAAVTFLQPAHPLLNDPNRITAADFEGWVQERGLSFASSWDSSYQAVLSCHDPGEPARNGGLLSTRYGKGCFIYTGYAFFRQLPAGVEGGYRLFVNLLEAQGGR